MKKLAFYSSTIFAFFLFFNTTFVSATDSFVRPIPTGETTLGDLVWNDANHNGIQDQGETGISGVLVTLTNDLLERPSLHTTTSKDGYYVFNSVPNGTYYLSFELPNGYAFTEKDQSKNDCIDSDVNAKTGNTDNFTLSTPNDVIDTCFDAGMYKIPEPTPTPYTCVTPTIANLSSNWTNNYNSIQINWSLNAGGNIFTDKDYYEIWRIAPGELDPAHPENYYLEKVATNLPMSTRSYTYNITGTGHDSYRFVVRIVASPTCHDQWAVCTMVRPAENRTIEWTNDYQTVSINWTVPANSVDDEINHIEIWRIAQGQLDPSNPDAYYLEQLANLPANARSFNYNIPFEADFYRFLIRIVGESGCHNQWAIGIAAPNIEPTPTPTAEPTPTLEPTPTPSILSNKLEIGIEKMVRKSGDTKWSKMVTVGPNDSVEFRIKIKNLGDYTLNNVKVGDVLPEHLELTSEASAWTINNLAPQDEVTLTLTAAVNADGLKAGTTTTVVNTASATYGNAYKNSDSAKVNIKTPKGQVLGDVDQLPDTGLFSNMIVGVILVGLLLAAIFYNAGTILNLKYKR
ncbi:DUF11 domain-containing protein [candidate division WWE3 bacterium]|uniref:DUF11 domain-containing protein n=1 Tax=candidate division WWE3 bacterium TaxID=2053526 RepID=A0A955LK77_UNCKA|nr:DUF11 domain-containing protein [candidate division WWE3 bacterium]